MSTLGQIITDDLSSKLHDAGFLNDILEITAEVFVQSTKDLTEEGLDASGNPFEPLGQVHASRKGGDYRSDMRYKWYEGNGAMDYIEMKLYSDDSLEFNFPSPTNANRYMEAHQYGLPTGRSTMPERRWAPNEEDMDSAIQQQNLEVIEEFINDYLQESTTIVGARIVRL